MARGTDFEMRVAKLLRLLGYQVEGEQVIDGNRVDLVARYSAGFEELCYLVECKNYAERNVAKEKVERFATWLQGRQAREMDAKGIFVATGFSPAALTFAKSQGIMALTIGELENRLFDFRPHLTRLRQGFEQSPLARTYVPQRVLLEAAPNREGEELLEYAQRWAAGEAGKKLWLLLGDYGTGKTVFFKRLACALARRAEEDPTAPRPLAIDLKLFPNAVTLEGLIQEFLRQTQGWTGNPEALIHLIHSGRVILLLDAFDEMGTAAAGVSVEDQFRQLARGVAGAGRVLITCRTHFFRDQQQIKEQFLGSGDPLVSHDSPLGELARTLDAALDELMLFAPEQIQLFLERHLREPGAIRRAEEFIATTYDLPSLATRPVMLEMILTSLPRLMALGQGTRITPAGLYLTYTNQWLQDRSGGNLRIPPKVRREILELLAHDLWRRPGHAIHYRELERLLAASDPVVFGQLDPARVDLELRTASFLTRSAEGNYTFSHKSFREFFLARRLVWVVRERGEELADTLDLPPLTREVAAFFGDLLEPADWKHLEEGIPAILSAPCRPRVSENALRLAYHLARQPGCWPQGLGERELEGRMARLVPRGARLAGAQLGEERLPGAWLEGAELSGAELSGADLTGAWLGRARLEEARLVGALLSGVRAEGADFSRADLEGATLARGGFAGARLTGARLVGVEGRGADLTGADLGGAHLAGARLMGTDLTGADLTGADATAARFSGAELTGVVWEGATLTRATAPGASHPPPELPPRPRG